MKKHWRENIRGWESLDYVYLQNVPMRASRKGPLIDTLLEPIERKIARALVESRNPLRGKEVKFLRRITGLSLHKFAQKLGLTPGAVYHWEKAPDQRLMPVNEIAVRVLCAEEFSVELPAVLSRLIGSQTEIISFEIGRSKRRV